jgi:3D (Asp-Asp-Asp) domain-containing protein
MSFWRQSSEAALLLDILAALSLIREDERASLDGVPSIKPRKGTIARFLVERSRSRFRRASWCAAFGVVSLVAQGCAGRVHPNGPATTGPPASESSFTATAYCTGRVTATGTTPADKTVAADPAVLAMGSRIRLTGLDRRYNGAYIVTDTGSRVRGRRIDLFIRDCHEAVKFGRRRARVSVLQ